MDKTNENNLKGNIEKGLILGALLVIISVLFLFPEYQTYRDNGEILKELNNTKMGYPEEMSLETYRTEIQMIRDNLEASKKNIPDTIDSAALYASIILMVGEAQIDLVSVAFKPITISMDESVGIALKTDYDGSKAKSIIGPDQRTLAKCAMVVVLQGDEKSCIHFIQAIKNHQPVLKVNEMGIKEEKPGIKTMTLNLESYGTLDQATVEGLNQP
ncbi:hypothetical protein AKG39_12490 [Acetobacterium bakii]|uniref:Uncharacterized protein n=1 Tax=Acetobacterium bakii TaxID=52689 RepID=A0A0L6TYT9_9FIRM|nr:hypothetical protein AKG39_12490 [Acetobacterium bakii]